MLLQQTFRRTVTILAIAVTAAFAAAAPASAGNKPSIKASPASLSIGDNATVQGRGFKPRMKFVLTINDAQFTSGTTNKKGHFKLTFVIPDGALQDLSLKASCGGKSATADLTVADGDPNTDGATGIDGSGGDLQGGIDNGDPSDSSDIPQLNF
jgi:hypothetical protein